MICNMVMEKRVGIMLRLSILVHFIRGRKMGRVDLNGKMEVFMKEIL